MNRQINTQVLSVRILPNADPALLQRLKVRPGDCSLGIFTTDCDDVSYTALDEATKKANVSVAYAKSMYAGSANASTALAGEFIGILSGPGPEEVRSGLDAAFSLIENDAHFYTANERLRCILCPLHFPDRQLFVRPGRCPGRHGHGLSDCAASGGDGRSGCRA